MCAQENIHRTDIPTIFLVKDRNPRAFQMDIVLEKDGARKVVNMVL